MTKAKTVMVAGAFDPLHPGHLDFFRQAKRFGEHLVVIVARDANIRKRKGREPFQSEDERLAAVQQHVPLARIGNKGDMFAVIDEVKPDVIVLGYDQKPTAAELKEALEQRGFAVPQIETAKPYKPDRYKSTYYR